MRAALAVAGVVAGLALAILLSGRATAPAAGAAGAVDDPSRGSAASATWAGEWYTYWRGGQAVLSIDAAETAGSEVRFEGVYRPGNGRIEGLAEGARLAGTWVQAGASGRFEFAMSRDGQSFAGRFGSGDYWNGERFDGSAVFDTVAGSGSPRAAMASVLEAMAAADRGIGAAELALRRFLVLQDNEPSLRERNDRIARLLRLISLATFRLSDMPEAAPEDIVTVEIGPDGTNWTFPLRLRRGLAGLWDVEVPQEAELARIEASLLDALEVTGFDEINPTAQRAPRQVVEDFLVGTGTWHSGGRGRALDTLDLSEIPDALRPIDGPLAAEYLRHTFDRIGHPVLQEVPFHALRRAPVTLYVNSGGAITIARVDQDPPAVADGAAPDTGEAPAPVWAFSAETLRAAPDIYRAVQTLSIAPGVEPVGALTRAFWVRDRLRAVWPGLLERTFALENWQWLALLLSIPISIIGSLMIARALRHGVQRVLALGSAAPETQASMARAFGWPARLYAAGLIVLLLVRELGLRQEASAIGNGLAGLVTIVGGATFIFHLVDAVAGSLARSAARTVTQYDDIAVAVGGGVTKVGIVVAAIFLAAELVGLPYEGVVATLGIGGLALGFAARDAVSNFISAGILLADRPFRKGDLVEAAGRRGIVEDVGLRSTRLRTLDDTVVVVPNAKISEDQVNNWGRLRHRQLRLILHVALDTPRDQLEPFVGAVEAAFARRADAVPGALIGLHDITPRGFVVTVLGYLQTPALEDFVRARHAFVSTVVDLAEARGIAFAEGDGDEGSSLPSYARD